MNKRFSEDMRILRDQLVIQKTLNLGLIEDLQEVKEANKSLKSENLRLGMMVNNERYHD